MDAEAIRNAARAFVELVENTERSAENTLAELVRVLDLLAFAQHHVTFSFDNTEYPEPPDLDRTAVRELVCKRFPEFGYYNSVLNVTTEIGEPTFGVGDAIDDVEDIYCDLKDVLWAWSATSEADALWQFQFGYTSHWRDHLRGLQVYMEALTVEA